MIYLNDTSIRKLIVLNEDGSLSGQLLLLLNIVAHIAQLLFHHPHSLKVSRVIEGIAPQEEQLDHVHGYISSSNIQSPVGVSRCLGHDMMISENAGKTCVLFPNYIACNLKNWLYIETFYKQF